MYRVAPLVILAAAQLAAAEDKPLQPAGPPPEVMVAQAMKADGQVRLRLSGVVPVVRKVTTKVWRNGRAIERPSEVTEYQAVELTLAADSMDLQPFGADGKPVDRTALLKRLAEPTPVAVFRDTSKPDPYYLRILRPDLVVLILHPRTPETKNKPDG